LDFWLDALRMGAFFQPSARRLTDLVFIFAGRGKDSPAELIWRSVPARLRKVLRRKVFIDEFVLESEMRRSKEIKNLRLGLLNVFKEEAGSFPETERIANNLILFLKRSKSGKLREGEKREAWKKELEENFQLKQGILDQWPDTGNLSFCLHPALEPDFERKTERRELIEKRLQELVRLARGTRCEVRLSEQRKSAAKKRGERSEEKRRAKVEQGKQQQQRKAIDFLGLDVECNGLNNFFGEVFEKLRSERGLKQLKEQILVLPLWQGKEDELERRLRFLAASARSLPASKLTGKWSDYRGTLGGKIKSWWSNYMGFKLKLAKLLPAEEAASACLVKLLSSSREEEGDLEELRRNTLVCLRKNLGYLEEITASGGGAEALVKLYRKYGYLRGEIRRNLIRLIYQGKIFETEREKLIKKAGGGPISPRKCLPSQARKILDNLPRLPRFLGEAAGEEVKLMQEGPRALKIAYELALDADRQLREGSFCPPARDRYLHVLNSLLSLYHRLNSNILTATVERIIGEATRKKEVPPSGRLFYVSPKAPLHVRERLVDAPGISADGSKELAKQWERLITLTSPSSPERFLQHTTEQQMDEVELLKIRLAFLLHCYPKTSIAVERWRDLACRVPQTSASLLSALESPSESRLRREERSVVLNELGSVLRGIVTRKSRRAITLRSTIQLMGAEKKLQLIAAPVNPRDARWKRWERKFAREKSLSGQALSRFYRIPHRFGYYLKVGAGFRGRDGRGDNKREAGAQVKCLAFKEKGNEAELRSIPAARIAWIRTSREQLQFLEWLLVKPRRKRAILLKRREPMLVVERDLVLKWKREKLEAEAGTSPKLFINQPFQIIPQFEDENVLRLPYRRFLGVDIGEYGVGWCVLEEKGEKLRIVRRGFLYEPLVREVREYVAAWRESQVFGLFASPETKLARLRENAAHKIRNRLHDIALRYHAQPVYEYQVSAFEAGGDRVKRLYDSIKRADKIFDSRAPRALKSERVSVWGDNSKWGEEEVIRPGGAEVSARATSRTCTSCWRSVLDEGLVPREEKFRVEWLGQGVIRLNKEGSGRRQVSFFGFLSGKYKGVTEVIGQEARALAEKFSRPPLPEGKKGVPRLSVALRFAFRERRRRGFSVPSLEQLAQFYGKRGSRALFICPFCLHIADADQQAALLVALTRWYSLEYGGGRLSGKLGRKAQGAKYFDLLDLLRRIEGSSPLRKKIELLTVSFP
jgi:hypothetical protein